MALLGYASISCAAPVLIAHGSLTGATRKLENGLSQNVLGGLGSGLAWAGESTFLATPDRGPNANAYKGGATVDNTVSYISRFQTLDFNLVAAPSGGLPYTFTPTLTNTTLLYSDSPLNYGAAAGVLPNDARFDPEAIRVSNDGKSVFVSNEYGPSVYQFDRATGERIKVFTLPDNVAIANLSSNGATEIANNTSGRVANKGMEGLAITPDGKTLVGFMQSPLKQDGGDGGRANRMITIDIASGETREYAYDNKIGNKNYNSSEILALNDHRFLVLERDGKGLGDVTPAVVNQIYAVD